MTKKIYIRFLLGFAVLASLLIFFSLAEYFRLVCCQFGQQKNSHLSLNVQIPLDEFKSPHTRRASGV
jgi:hypothetical protein